MPEPAQLPAPRKKRNRILREKFTPCVKVVLPDSSRVLVPVDKLSSDNQRTLLVAMARDFVESQLMRLKPQALTPAEVKDMIKAVADLDALQREQFVTALNNKRGSADVSDIVSSAAAGATAAAAGFMAKIKEFQAVKPVEPKPVVKV